MKVRVQSHACYQLLYHVVWIPKYRRKILIKGVDTYCDKLLRSLITDRYPDVFLEELSVQEDHIHIMLSIPPKYSIAEVVGYLKRNSSLAMRKKFEYLRRISDGMWSVGYFVSSVGLDEAKIRKYILHQNEQDKGQLIEL